MQNENLLSEVTVYKNPNGKWFRNSQMDVTIEFHENGQIKSFQIDYTEKLKSYSLSWIDFQLKDYIIDDGEDHPSKNNAPIAVGERKERSPYLAQAFEKMSKQMPAEMRSFILEKL